MANFTLELKTESGKNEISLSLTEFAARLNFNDVNLFTHEKAVFSDVKYTKAILRGDKTDDILNVDVFINDQLVSTAENADGNAIVIDLGVASFPVFQKQLLFRDCYGYVQLNLKIQYDNSVEILYSDYLAVYFKDSIENQSIKKMIDYIYENHEKFLYDSAQKPSEKSGLKDLTETKGLSVIVDLLREIVSNYDTCYPYFKTNAKSKIIETGVLTDFEKLSSIKPQTLVHIVQHPEELYPIASNSGIYINRSYFVPKKTLAFNSSLSYNIYENKVIVSFLKTLHNAVTNLITHIQALIGNTTPQSNKYEGYTSTVSFFYAKTINQLIKYKSELGILRENLFRLHKAYIDIFSTDNMDGLYISAPPEPTAIFTSIPQYSVIFQSIVRWFRYGNYDLEKEEFILPMLVNNQIYEYYTLLKLLNIIGDVMPGAELSAARFEYKGCRMYTNTNFVNTFTFKKDGKEITLYYQPVIYGMRYKEADCNGIKIYRNSSLRINRQKEEDTYSPNAYYVPDYLVKFSENGKSKYIILDAKYAEISTVRTFYLSELIFKYDFSLSTEQEDDFILGMIILCGKSMNVGKQIINAHDISERLNYSREEPFSFIFNLNEDVLNGTVEHLTELLSQ